MTRGKFIVFEGADGAGTTTQSRLLKKALDVLDIPSLRTFEPSSWAVGVLLREILSGKHGPLGEVWGWREMSYLFMADRIQHVKLDILPALNEGTNVICDRYYASTLVYQSTGAGFHSEQHDRMSQLLSEMRRSPGFLEPDLWLYLRALDVVTLEERRSSRGAREIYEDRKTQGQVVDLYEAWSARKSFSGGGPVRRVDCTKPIREVFTDCLRCALMTIAADRLDEVEDVVQKVLESDL